MANVFLIKAAASAGSSKTGRKIIGGILGGIAALILFVISAFSGLVSILIGGNQANIELILNAQNTQVYKDIKPCMKNMQYRRKFMLRN